MLHALDNIVFLISSICICHRDHEFMSHDACVLALFPLKIDIPFVLVHHTGFTAEFIEMCNSLVRSGMNFYNMESMILERRWRMYARNLNRIGSLNSRTQSCSLEGFQSFYLSNTPTDTLLTKCFLSKIRSQEHLYLNDIASVKTCSTISFDHTFKVAANIGYHREDGVWVSQYNSLFLVMNGNGQVVTWQLRSSTSLDQVQSVLRCVSERSKKQQQPIECIYADDCCKVRKKLQTIFGNMVEVKLDF